MLPREMKSFVHAQILYYLLPLNMAATKPFLARQLKPHGNGRAMQFRMTIKNSCYRRVVSCRVGAACRAVLRAACRSCCFTVIPREQKQYSLGHTKSALSIFWDNKLSRRGKDKGVLLVFMEQFPMKNVYRFSSFSFSKAFGGLA